MTIKQNFFEELDTRNIYEYLIFDCGLSHDEAASAQGWCELANYDEYYEGENDVLDCAQIERAVSRSYTKF